MESLWSQLTGWVISKTGQENLWTIEVFIVVLLTLFIAFAVGRSMAKLKRKTDATKNLWDDALVHAVTRPLRWFIWVMGLSFAASIVGQHSESILFNSIGTIRHVAGIFIVTWFIHSFLLFVEKNLIDPGYMRKPLDKTTAVAVGKLLRISVIITAGLIALQSLGYSISGVLAFGGIGGIAVGFAAKDLLANFFGGLIIYLDRPFSVGDWIRSPDKNIEGTVEDIGWRITRIMTFDKRPLYVPNSTFTQISVENPSRMSNRRIYEKIGVRYDDARLMAVIVRDVKLMLEQHEAIEQNLTLMVNFNEFSASSLDFFVYCFTKTKDWAEFHEIKQDVMLQVLAIIDKTGAECAFPTSTLHLPDGIRVKSSVESTINS